MKKAIMSVPDDTFFALKECRITNPHAVLGLHELNDSQKIIRVWNPSKSQLSIKINGNPIQAQRINEGLFDLTVPSSVSYKDYQIETVNGDLAYDPYAFEPTFLEQDKWLFEQGHHYELYKKMGARLTEHQGCKGVKFALWAPAAQSVAVVGDFNHWDGRLHPMRRLEGTGVWELFIPDLKAGTHYKFEMKTFQGHLQLKSDPYALFMEKRPSNASIIFDVDAYKWNDALWIEKRNSESFRERPMNVYEVHLGSWKRKNGDFMNYRELAIEIAKYVKEMGFSHVELMPLTEHPLDESWGYQVTGFFAATSRFGTPEDFQFFVDHMHQNGIGVFMDWVPAHFPTDYFALAQFDGTYIYEHADPKRGFHPHWNTLIFNYGAPQVRNFLMASAFFWFDKMHIDGLRVDAVASMLYLDYGRGPGEWIPNIYGGNENFDAINFIKELNSIVHKRFPGVLMIAEESTAYYGVSHPLDKGGLGFDLKWNMGWMNDTLRYFEKDPIYRKHHHHELTFPFCYSYNENFVLVLSHDEVVHGKQSLAAKMPGDDWQRFANLRLLYSYMLCSPGKKLFFMSSELAQWNEWYCNEEIHWHLLKYSNHLGIQNCIKAMNHFYLEHPSLWELDFDYSGFRWIDYGDYLQSRLTFLRFSKKGKPLACVCNFTPTYHSSYFLPLQNLLTIREVFNSDAQEFGGSDKRNYSIEICKDQSGRATGAMIQVAPLSTMIFEVEFE